MKFCCAKVVNVTTDCFKKLLIYIHNYKHLIPKTSAAMLHYKTNNMASLPISSCTSPSNQVQKRILLPLSGLVSLRTIIIYECNCISLFVV